MMSRADRPQRRPRGGLRRWTLGDDEALLDVVTSANVACGFHAGDPSTMRRVCDAGGRARGGDRRAGRPTATWPGSAGAFIDVTRARARRRRALPARRARRRSPGSPAPGALRQAARRALQRRRATTRSRPRPSSRPSRAYDAARCPSWGCPARRCCGAAGGGRAAAVPEAFADRGYTAEGTLVPRAASPARVLHDAGRGRRARGADGPRRRGDRRRRHARRGRRSSRCACTATPRAPSGWPAPCAAAGVRRRGRHAGVDARADAPPVIGAGARGGPR